MTTKDQTPLALIGCKQVSQLTTLSKTAIYARITPNPKRPNDYDSTFPKPVRIGPNRVAWVRSEVEQWLSGKVEASRIVASWKS